MALGGWPELNVHEDLALALLLGEHCQGRILTEVMARHRDWPKQAVAQPSYQTDKQRAFKKIEAMVNEHRDKLGRPRVSAPNAGTAFGASAVTQCD